MKISITRVGGVMTVDGVPRVIQVDDLMTPQMEVIYFDNVRNRGIVQYGEDVTVQAQDRDLDAENTENERRKANNLPILNAPIMKTVTIQKAPDIILSLNPLFMTRWNAAAPPPPPPPPAPDPVTADFNTEMSTITWGPVTPKTSAELKAMLGVDLRTWFDANFTTQNQINNLIRKMFRVLVRRVF